MHKHKIVDNQRPEPEGTIFFSQHLQKAGYQTAFDALIEAARVENVRIYPDNSPMDRYLRARRLVSQKQQFV